MASGQQVQFIQWNAHLPSNRETRSSGRSHNGPWTFLAHNLDSGRARSRIGLQRGSGLRSRERSKTGIGRSRGTRGLGMDDSLGLGTIRIVVFVFRDHERGKFLHLWRKESQHHSFEPVKGKEAVGSRRINLNRHVARNERVATLIENAIENMGKSQQPPKDRGTK